MALEERPASGFFGLLPELRNAVYRLAFSGLSSDENERYQQVLVRPGDDPEFRQSAQLLSRCYLSLATSRQIYAEASPIFWGQMRVHLFAEPSFYAPQSPDPYDLESLGSWMTRSGIRSIRARRKDLPDGKSPEIDAWKWDCALHTSQGGLDCFDRVNTLYLRMTGYPMRLTGLPSDAVCARAIQTVVDNSVLPEAIEMVTSARVFKRSTLTTLDYLLSKLGGVKTVVLLGDADRAGFDMVRLQATATQARK
ncbi:hypothetical protein LTR53_010526 [Teratosphaeriaceae sp. CCFEE 6253]|nr:hypothetical protein LTR53_010526 [Teratosphaeriaceae sp. CCFEE 6253]